MEHHNIYYKLYTQYIDFVFFAFKTKEQWTTYERNWFCCRMKMVCEEMSMALNLAEVLLNYVAGNKQT